MGWWQEALRLVAALGWWQFALVLVATILIGILVSISVSYLIIRFVFKRRVPFFKLFYMLFSKVPKVFTSSDLARQFINTPSAPPEVHELAKFPIPELLVEIEHNLKIATEFSGDNLLPLQSDVWDAGRDSVHKLPVNLREQLEQVYFDIHLLNHTVWFSTEMGFRSSLLDEQYRERLTTITERLQRIKQNVEKGTLIEHMGRSGILRDGEEIYTLSYATSASKKEPHIIRRPPSVLK